MVEHAHAGERASRIPSEGLVFREPPDKGDSLRSSAMRTRCGVQAVSERSEHGSKAALCHVLDMEYSDPMAIKPKSAPKLTDAERHARFVETARKVEASEKPEDFDRAFKTVVSSKDQPERPA